MIEFANFQLGAQGEELLENGQRVEVQPKALAVLAYLARHRERVVPNAELIEELWRGTAVTDASLARAVSAARAAVGDDGREQRIIQTHRGRGYRFVAEVHGSERPGSVSESVRADAAAAAGERSVYVGRGALQEALRARVASCADGANATLLLRGPAGIGKSTAVSHLVDDARRSGFECHTVWCSRGGVADTVGFGPWQQLLRAILRSRSQESVREALGHRGRELAAFAPAFAELLPELRDSQGAASEEGSYARFQAVGEFLERAASERPLLLVIEDLHWAERGSIALLEFLSHSLSSSRLVLVATFRPEDLSESAAARASFERVLRSPAAEEHEILPLGAEAIQSWIATQTPSLASPAVAAWLEEHTGGNPLFIDEVLRWLREQGVEDDPASVGDALPRGLRALVARRVLQLAAPGPALLEWAAVMGEGLDAEALAAVAQTRVEDAVEALRGAHELGLLAPSDEGRGYRFAHDLLRESLYQALAPAHRARLHERIGERLESLRESMPAGGVGAEELAHHFAHAAAGEGRERALRYAIEAGFEAHAASAADRAVAHLERAIRWIDEGVGTSEARERFEILLACGDAHHALDDRAASRRSSERAFGLACELGDATLIARAALCLAGDRVPVVPDDEVCRGALRDALKALADAEPNGAKYRPLVLARLAADGGPATQLQEVKREAIARARALPEVRTLARVILTHFGHVMWALPLGERSAVARECLERALAEGDAVSEVAARRLLLECLIEAGEFEALDEHVAICSGLAHGGADPRILFALASLEVSRLGVRGELAEAEQRLLATAQLGRRYHVAGVDAFFGLQLVDLRTQQGRLDEAKAMLEPFARILLPEATYLARVLAERGEFAAARDQIAAAWQRFADPRDDTESFFGAAQLCRAVAMCDDTETAAALVPLIAPFAGSTLHRIFWAIYGTADHHVGLLFTTLGRYEEAERSLDAALERARALGAASWEVDTLYARANLFARRDAPGDAERASHAAAAGRDIAEALGLPLTAQRCELLLGDGASL